VRRYLPELIDLIWNRKIKLGKVFDLTLLLEEMAEGTGRWMNVARLRRCCASKEMRFRLKFTPQYGTI